MKGIHVFSEIGKLKKVLVHKPGKELENLTPDLLERLLFDDIPHLAVAQQEHARFVEVLQENGVEVVYTEQLVRETLEQNPHLKSKFVADFIREAKVHPSHQQKLHNYLLSLSNMEMINVMFAGLEVIDLDLPAIDNYPFVIDPLPNSLFQRDPQATIGNGVTINKMASVTRNRETLFAELIFKHHADFNGVPHFFNRNNQHTLEGGDVLVLNQTTLIIGATERTSLEAIKQLAKNIIASHGGYETVYILELPKKRAYMHLDTVLTNVDIDKFVVHPLIFNDLNQFKVLKVAAGQIVQLKQTLMEFLSNAVGQQVNLIPCGGNSPIAAGREQWNDGTNVLAIRPGVVISYARNHVTNQLMRENGITVLEIPSSELSRGRGGPRCMSMPLIREDL